MKILNIIYLSTILIACNAPEARESEGQNRDSAVSEAKTKEIVSHHLEAFKNNDLEEIMKDYTEESVFIAPDATYTGLEQIRTSYENVFKAFPKDSMTFTLEKTVVAEDVGYILWKAKTPSVTVSYGTDTFIIRDGKIIRQTFAGVFE
jgi:ketosteroid isomerase-like protein